MGIDGNPEMIERAMAGCQEPNIRWCLNLEEDDLCRHIREGSCGAAVSFETLEHLNDPGRAVISSPNPMPEGFFICSVPNVISESGDDAGLPKNRSHKQWFNFLALPDGGTTRHEGDISAGPVTLKNALSKKQQLFNARRIRRRLRDETVMHSEE